LLFVINLVQYRFIVSFLTYTWDRALRLTRLHWSLWDPQSHSASVTEPQCIKCWILGYLACFSLTWSTDCWS